jgi:predicted PurR-regulated permease PerM
MENQERRIKRLENAVRGLTIVLILSIGFSIYAFYQITAITSSIPSYRELKEDIKSIKNAAPVIKEKVDYTTEKVADGYNYTKEKVSEGYDYTKEKANDVIDYFSGDDDASKDPAAKEKK